MQSHRSTMAKRRQQNHVLTGVKQVQMERQTGNKSKLQLFIDYCNEHAGSKIQRTDYVKLTAGSLGACNTVDTYRRMFEVCGYLHKIEDGVYMVMQFIEPMTLSQLRAKYNIANRHI